MALSVEVDHEAHPLEEGYDHLQPDVLVCAGTVPPVILAVDLSMRLAEGSVLPKDADPHNSTAKGVRVEVDLELDQITAKRYEKGHMTVKDVLRYAAAMIIAAEEAGDS